MAELVITRANGGKSMPVGMTVVPEPQEITLRELRALGREAGVSGASIANELSAFAMHERVAARFARAAAAQASTEELKELHAALGREHLAHLEVLTALMANIGLDPMYVAPSARMAAYQIEGATRASLLEGSAGWMGLEIAQLDAALVMAQMSRSTRRVIAALAEQVPPSAMREALQAAAARLATIGEAFGRVGPAREALLVDFVLHGE